MSVLPWIALSRQVIAWRKGCLTRSREAAKKSVPNGEAVFPLDPLDWRWGRGSRRAFGQAQLLRGFAASRDIALLSMALLPGLPHDGVRT